MRDCFIYVDMSMEDYHSQVHGGRKYLSTLSRGIAWERHSNPSKSEECELRTSANELIHHTLVLTVDGL